MTVKELTGHLLGAHVAQPLIVLFGIGLILWGERRRNRLYVADLVDQKFRNLHQPPPTLRKPDQGKRPMTVKELRDALGELVVAGHGELRVICWPTNAETGETWEPTPPVVADASPMVQHRFVLLDDV
jgi:hypothetical protein